MCSLSKKRRIHKSLCGSVDRVSMAMFMVWIVAVVMPVMVNWIFMNALRGLGCLSVCF